MTDTTARDELAREIFIADNSAQTREDSLADWTAYGMAKDSTYAHNIADGLIAAGYRKPRTITEHYGDEGIESLACGSVILAGITTSTLQSDGTWLDSWGSTYDFYELNLPATLLHDGGAA